ncbi:MAG: DUF6489 family protein [Gammaproteobacteria bacterium]
MKIRIEVEVGPTELREFLGLPDVSHLQEEAVDALARRVRSGATTGMEAVAMLRNLVPQGLATVSELQRLAVKALQSGEGVHMETTVEPKKSASGKKKPSPARKSTARKKRGPSKRAS